MKNENGFSLLEVSVAVTIMAILTGLGFSVASIVNEGNGTKAAAYETSGQDSIDYTECSIDKVYDSSNVCSGGGGGAGGGGSTGVIAVWDGSLLSANINPSICSVGSNSVSYYYTNSGNGTVLMSTNTAGSYNPSAGGYPLGGNLGFGVTIVSYYVMVDCSGTPTRSDNDVF